MWTNPKEPNLSGCGVGVLAVGGGGDAVALKDLLSMLQHGLIAELQVELETRSEIHYNSSNFKSTHSDVWCSSKYINHFYHYNQV